MSDSIHLKYRSDIDGLRAVAVSSVIAFHAFPGSLPGGFIGVDIFFVISGFLISGIIFKNLENRSFSFLHFYQRRILRIFPALLLMLVTTMSLGWMALFAGEFEQLGKHVTAGSAFVANLAYWFESGYFDQAGESKPLLHLWSLGVEEQFYIVWPVLIYLAWLLRFNLLTLILLLFIVSFVGNIVETARDATSAFFLPHTRCWELSAGSLLAWINLYPQSFHKNPYWQAVKSKAIDRLFAANQRPTLNNMMSILALLILAMSLFLIRRDSAFPGWTALMPVLSAGLFIAAGPKASINRLFLSHPLAIWLGLISYPLYLWHWPLLTFARLLHGSTPDIITRIAVLLLSLSLAWLTFKLLESPLRYGKYPRVKTTALLCSMCLMGFLGYGAYTEKGFPSRSFVNNNAQPESGWDGGTRQQTEEGCPLSTQEALDYFAICVQDKRGNIKYLLLGDSKARALWGGLIRTSQASARWSFIGGPDGYGAVIPLISEHPEFKDFQIRLAGIIQAMQSNSEIETVVLTNAIRSLFRIRVRGDANDNTYNHRYMESLPDLKNYQAVKDGLLATVTALIKTGKNVVFVMDNPALPEPVDCLARTTSIAFIDKYLGNINQDCFVKYSHFKKITANYREILVDIQNNFPKGKVLLFDASAALCDSKSDLCGPARQGRPLYSYSDHISDFASGLIGQELNAVLNGQRPMENASLISAGASKD